MLPWPMVLSMLGSLAAYNQLLTAQAVRSAATAAATAGAAAGATATAAAANPRGLFELVRLPLRLANAPFYYLLGGYSADRRLRTLELANAHLAAAQAEFVSGLEDKRLVFDALQVRLSEDYINRIKSALELRGGAVDLTNPIQPSLCSVGSFEDPFNEIYTVIVLNDLGHKMVVAVLVTVAAGSAALLLVFVFRRLVRYGIRGFKATKKIVIEENMRDQRDSLKTSYLKDTAIPSQISNNYLTS